MVRSTFGLALWILGASVSTSLLGTAITLGLLTLGHDKLTHNGIEAGWFALWLGISFAFWYSLYKSRIEPWAEKNEVHPNTELEDFCATIKLLIDFALGAFILVYGLNHPKTGHGFRHGWVLTIVGSIGALGSSVLGLYFVRTAASGFGIFTAALLQFFVFFATDSLWFLSGWVVVAFVISILAFAVYCYDHKYIIPQHLRSYVTCSFIFVCAGLIALYGSVGWEILSPIDEFARNQAPPPHCG